MALTKVTTGGITDATIATADIADNAVTAAKLASGAADLLVDTSPQLGGNLDTNGFEIALDSDKSITFDGKGNIEYKSSQFQITNSTGDILIDNNASGGDIKIYTDTDFEVFVDNGDDAIKAIKNGAVELYHSGTKKLETTTAGVKLPDGQKVEFGDDDDLEIFHYQTDDENIINSHKPLLFMSNGNTRIQSNTGEDMIKAVPDGAVELYYNNSKKIETTSGGVEVFGELQMDDANSHIKVPDNARIDIGTGNDLQLYHDGNNSNINDAGTGYLAIRSNNIRFENAAANQALLYITENGSVDLYHANEKKLYTYADGVYVQDDSSAGAYLVIATNAGSQGSLYGTANTLGLLDGQNHYMLKGVKDGSVELYHDNSKKLETASYGSQVTGYQVQTNFPIASLSDNNTGNLNTTTLQDSQLNSSNFYSHTNINQGSHFNASTGKFTCPVDGVYRIYFRISSTANANIRLRKNGNTINEAYDSVYSSGEVKSVSSEIIVGCSANDYLDVQVSTLKVISGTQHKQVTFQLIA